MASPGKPSPMSAAPMPFVAPEPAELAKHFPLLEILQLLGQGGMGAVYKARQTKLDRLVALKILPPAWGQDPAFAERFTREARALARLSHPNIVSVHDFGESGGLFYFIMEFVDGASLRQVLLEGRLAPAESLKIIPQLCDALQYAHDESIVHRDIKPENILLDRKGRVKIADFGLAKLVGTAPAHYTLTGSRQIMGTPHYMAPEQMEKPQTVDHRADIYSLGVVFYEMLTGELPLGRFAPPSRKAAIDGRLDEVVLRALAKEPQERYQKISELKAQVENQGTARTPVLAHAAAQRTLSLRFLVADNWCSQALGLIRLEGEHLVFEFQLDYMGFHKSSVTAKEVPIAELVQFELENGWLCSKVLIAANRLSTLDGIPGNRLGQLHLNITNKDRAVAEELTQAVQAQLSGGASLSAAAPALEAEAEIVQFRLGGQAGMLRLTAIFAFACWILMGLYVMTTSGGSRNEHLFVAHRSFMLAFFCWQLLALSFCALMVVGAAQLRRLESYVLVILAAVVAMLPWSPHVLLGFPVGLWILVTLRRWEVKRAFRGKMHPRYRPAPVPSAPAPTGVVERKARSIVRAFRTLFFDSYAESEGNMDDPQSVPTTAAPAAAKPAQRPTTSVPAAVSLKRESNTGVLLLGLFLGLVALVLLLLVGWMMLRLNHSATFATVVTPAPPMTKTTPPVSRQPRLVPPPNPERMIKEFLRPLKLDSAHMDAAAMAITASCAVYFDLEKRHTEARFDPSGKLHVHITPFGADRLTFENDFWDRLDRVLTVAQQEKAREPSFAFFFPSVEATIDMEIWKVGQWFHWHISCKVDSTATSESGSDAKLPVSLERFWKLREIAPLGKMDKIKTDRPKSR